MPEKRVVGVVRQRAIGIAGRIATWSIALLPASALALPNYEQLCPGQTAVIGADGRVLGHIAYREATRAELVTAPAGFAIGQQCLVARDMAPDLARLLAAAAATPGVGKRLRGVSCFRSIARQRWVFCSQIGPGKRCRTAAERAMAVGPPAYSEHASGYAIDFGIRPSPGCPDLSSCIAGTVAGRWLIAHAPDYGFELSFPVGNAQGVTWEPWHWRWVGTSIDQPGAARARLTFARARTAYPASPAIADRPDAWLHVIRPTPATTPISWPVPRL